VAIWPVFRGDDTRASILETLEKVATELRARTYDGRPVEVETDLRDISGGDKQWEWIKKGIPIRIEVGPRDVASGAAPVARRDRAPKEREVISFDSLPARIPEILAEIQQSLLDRAFAHRDAHTQAIDERADFDRYFTPKNAEKPELHGGFALSHWCGSSDCEARIKEALKVTIRCVPTFGIERCAAADRLVESGRCIVCDSPSERRVVFAKSY
jgi:prolyl-tRNA synthetase